MSIEPRALLAILGMAAVTYLTRAGGLWLLRRLGGSPTGRAAVGLRAIPGAVLVAIVAPNALGAGPAGAVAALATAIVALRTGRILVAMATGVVLVLVWRRLT